ncbi:MAG: gamma-glutamyl-gamma-aminobutyrate hydrolase family protein [Clostridia bacterium]|nr:gamma-glutamyl-gamma-aminobutyrate hydrolase family protein [Clostridia bacterium]
MSSSLRIAIPALSDAPVANYVSALQSLGAQPVRIGAAAQVSSFDGLLLPGGWDINPDRYAQENVSCRNVDDELDALQFDAADAFISSGKPVFGICRGHQLLNVYFGGTLIQDIPSAACHSSGVPGTDLYHASRSAEGSFLSSVYGSNFRINSSHHQAVDRPGTGLQIVQYSHDGVVEALSHETRPIWCVQWHPERLCGRFATDRAVDGSLILKWFLDRCK